MKFFTVLCLFSLLLGTLPASSHALEGLSADIVLTENQITEDGSNAETATLADQPELQQVLSASVGRDNSVYHVQSTTNGYMINNPQHQYDAVFFEDSIQIEAGADTWGLALTHYGRIGEQLPVVSGQIQVVDNRITYMRDGWSEWYINGSKGLQQGFTLHQPPVTTSGGDIRLTMQMDGTFTAELNENTLYLTSKHGTQLQYGGLIAYDAYGRELPAHLELVNDQLAIVVDDHHATYPVTIDPWVTQAQILSDDFQVNDYFGYAVAVSGNTAIIGAPKDSDDGSESGSAYVFVRTQFRWAQQQKLTASDAASGDWFGNAVDIDGNTAIIGSPNDSLDKGAAYVFTRSGSTWSQQQKLTASDGLPNYGFGGAVAIDGDELIIGAPYDGGVGTGNGAAYVFVSNGAFFVEEKKLTASDGVVGDLFGWAVDIYGDAAIVGARGNNFAGFDSGAAYVYMRLGSSWLVTLQQKLTAYDANAYDYFGIDVAIHAATVIVGAPGYDATSEDIGAAYVFVRSSQTWSHQQKLIAMNSTTGQEFGSAVDVYGDTAVIGAPYAGGVDGAAFVFTRSSTTWTEQQKLTANGPSADRFGEGVAISTSNIIVGTFSNTEIDPVYAFRFTNTPPENDALVLFNPANSRTSLYTSVLNAPSELSYINTPPSNTAPEWVMGDWNSDGVRTPGLFDSGVFRYTNDLGPTTNWSNGIWLGNAPGRVAVVSGRFDNSFTNECIAWVDSSTSPVTGDKRFSLKWWCDMTASGAVTLSSQWLGAPLGDSGGFSGTHQFVYGDWDSDGLAEPGIRRGGRINRSSAAPSEGAATYPPGTAQRWDTSDGDGPGAHGLNDGLFVAGDWNGDGVDTWGVVYDDNTFYYRDVFGFNPGPYAFSSQTFSSSVSAPRQVDSHHNATGGSSAPGPAGPVVLRGSENNTVNTGANFDTSRNVEAELAVSKAGNYQVGEVGLVGDSIVWTITVANTGTAPANSVKITDNVPAELRVDDALSNNGMITVRGQTVIFNVESIGVGETVQFQVVTTILNQPASGTFANSVNVVVPDGNGSGSDANLVASGTVSGVDGLPATGYARRFPW